MSILEELMRGGESRSDPMDDDRGGAEERRRGRSTRQNKEGRGQAGAGDESGG